MTSSPPFISAGVERQNDVAEPTLRRRSHVALLHALNPCPNNLKIRRQRHHVGAGVADQGGPFQTLSIRIAIHDDLDAPRGFPPGARLQMGDFHLRYEDRAQRVELDPAEDGHVPGVLTHVVLRLGVAPCRVAEADDQDEQQGEQGFHDRQAPPGRSLELGLVYQGGPAGGAGPKPGLLSCSSLPAFVTGSAPPEAMRTNSSRK